MNFEYWYMFPFSIVIATIAMASGVEGATFFTPLFMLVLKLPPEVAIGTGLITEVFGFSSGLFAYIRKGLIDFKLGKKLLIVTIPLALIGTWLGKLISPSALKAMLGVGLFVIAQSFLSNPESEEIEVLDANIASHSRENPQTCLTSNDGETFCYTIANTTEGRLLSGIGALFLGMVSTGLGELNGYFLIQRCKVPSQVAVATSVFIVAITALIASVGHVLQFLQAGNDELMTVLSLVIFTAPGVLIGAQFGSMVASKLSQKLLERSMGILFIIVGAIVLFELAVKNQDLISSFIYISMI
ncbi:sulfite exporter TauE/SafE family protein [Cyanobacterium aponinum]|uniref:Probable membrane transporter protein n=1 Tax=Cyanobacterium aponinum (strain PCC 10605) TaxID=755178 RepID=K9Z8D8_CYAAP|nr:sulfite exporter TauE/SafE family protein [Cyanobacterium aponinum]AFZ54638.1 protein of unknown function DUF81 [Cyanobacterium aponinum PCC 10605]